MGDRFRPEWVIGFTGMRTRRRIDLLTAQIADPERLFRGHPLPGGNVILLFGLIVIPLFGLAILDELMGGFAGRDPGELIGAAFLIFLAPAAPAVLGVLLLRARLQLRELTRAPRGPGGDDDDPWKGQQ